LQGTRLRRGVSGAIFGDWLQAKIVGCWQRRAPEALVRQKEILRKRSLEIYDYRAGAYFRQLEAFLGMNEI
jgi:hypothetical protein